MTYVVDNLKYFVISNNILPTTAAITIAFSSGIMIRSLIGDIIVPIIYGLFITSMKTKSLKSAFASITAVNISTFIKEFISWLMVIAVTFILIEYVFIRWLKTDNKIKEDNK